MKRVEGKAAEKQRRGQQDRTGTNRGRLFVRVLLLLVLATSGASAVLLVSRHWDELEPRLNPLLIRVEIDGEFLHLTPGEIREVLDPYAGIGFFDLDLAAARERVEALQWVEAAVVGRRWPDALIVRITEETVIARWGDDQLITQRGMVISPAFAEFDRSLPQLSGPADSHFEVMRQYQRLNQILYPAGLRLSGLSTSPRRSWRLQLNGVTEVVLGGEDLVNRLQRYVDFYRRQPESERRRHEVVDLRYGSQFSIRLRGEDLDTESEQIAGRGGLARR